MKRPECFVDRKEELALLLEQLRHPKRSVAIALAGESGAGKSALLRRLALEAQVLGLRTVTVNCHLEQTSPFTPLRELVENLVSSAVTDDRRNRTLRLRHRRFSDDFETSAGASRPRCVAPSFVLSGVRRATSRSCGRPTDASLGG